MNFKKTFLVALIFALLITIALPAVMGGMSSQVGQNLTANTVTLHSFQMTGVNFGPAYTSNNGGNCQQNGQHHGACPDVSWNS